MDFYFDNKKYYTIAINPENTIGDIKTMVTNWMLSKGDEGLINIRIVFSDGTELAQVVFADDKYNNTNLIHYKDVLTGGKIYIISEVYLQNKINYDKCIAHNTTLLSAIRDGQVEYVDRYLKTRRSYGRLWYGDNFYKKIRNAYHLAIELGYIIIVELFENSGELPRRQNSDGELKIASTYGHMDLVKYFLNKGVTIKGIRTSIDLAKSNGHHDIANHLQTVLNDFVKKGYR